MAFEYQGNTIDTNDNGFLTNQDDWSSDMAETLAQSEDITLSDKHWDVINYLREEFFENRENQPNTRAICKAMSTQWGGKVAQSDVYALFPLDPSKQGGKIAGLPESRRKGGY